MRVTCSISSTDTSVTDKLYVRDVSNSNTEITVEIDNKTLKVDGNDLIRAVENCLMS